MMIGETGAAWRRSPSRRAARRTARDDRCPPARGRRARANAVAGAEVSGSSTRTNRSPTRRIANAPGNSACAASGLAAEHDDGVDARRAARRARATGPRAAAIDCRARARRRRRRSRRVAPDGSAAIRRRRGSRRTADAGKGAPARRRRGRGRRRPDSRRARAAAARRRRGADRRPARPRAAGTVSSSRP